VRGIQYLKLKIENIKFYKEIAAACGLAMTPAKIKNSKLSSWFIRLPEFFRLPGHVFSNTTENNNHKNRN
jgi:hypothetical protein